MSGAHRYGFHFSRPAGWNAWWVRYWIVSSVVWASLPFLLPIRWLWFGVWCGVFTALFLVPEIVAVLRRDPRFPPLTQTIRHFLPNDIAFPLLWGLPGAAAGRWLGLLPWWRYFFCGVVTALLGWFTTHFTVTYARPDPHPHDATRGDEQVEAEPTAADTFVIRNPRPL